MAHAYQTFARQGKFVYGSMSPGAMRKGQPVPGPVGIRSIGRREDGKTQAGQAPQRQAGAQPRPHQAGARRGRRRAPSQTLLQGVVKSGTGTRASARAIVPVAGKTGTTENYGDAWFVGWTRDYTVAVWVGYPNKLDADEDRVQRRAGRRRHLPGRDLEDVHGVRASSSTRRRRSRTPRRPRTPPRARRRSPAPRPPPAPAAPAPSEPAPETDGGGGEAEPERRRTRRPQPEQPEDIPPAEQAPAPPTAPDNGETAPRRAAPPRPPRAQPASRARAARRCRAARAATASTPSGSRPRRSATAAPPPS